VPSRVAGGILSLQALTLGVLGVQLVVTAANGIGNTDVANGSGVYFLLLGAIVAVVAASVLRRRSWSFVPAIFIQLIAVPMAFTMAQEGFWLGVALVGGSALVCLVALLRRSGRRAFGRD
jgi:hypothetical protein